MTVDIVIVGAGKIGGKHARVLASMPEASVSAVVDVDHSAAERLAATVDAHPTDLETALDSCDAAYVCTPDDAHADVARRAIAAGVDTLVEKPLAATVEEASRLVDLAGSSDGVHMVGHVLRFDPRYQALRRQVDSGDVGSVCAATVERLVSRARARRTGAVSRPAMRLGVHDFDLLEWVTDRPVASVRATGADGALRAEGYDTEDVVAGVATLGNGVPVTVTLGYCVPDGHPGSIVGTRVVGTGGVAEVDGAPAASRQWTDDGGTAADTHLWPTVEGTPAGALANESHAFLDAVRSRGPSPVPYAAGRRAVAVARAFERAADTGDPQTVE